MASTYTCPRCLLSCGQEVSQTEEPGAAGRHPACAEDNGLIPTSNGGPHAGILEPRAC